MKQFDYVLNDLAFLNLAAKVCYSDSATNRDKQTLYEQLYLIMEENTRARHWDYNKDTRNSRQRIANKRMERTLSEYKEELKLIERVLTRILNEPSSELNIYALRNDIRNFLGDDYNVKENRRSNKEE